MNVKMLKHLKRFDEALDGIIPNIIGWISKDNITICWDIGLNKNRIAYFVFTKEDNEFRLVPGDELHLCYSRDVL